MSVSSFDTTDRCPFCELELMLGLNVNGHPIYGCGTVALPGDEFAQSPGCELIGQLREQIPTHA